MEQTMDEKVSETPQGETLTFRCISFRLSRDDENAIRLEAERRRTNVSSLIRGVLLQAGILKPLPKEG